MTTLSTKQAADYLGVSPRTLEMWRHRGTGPAYFKVGRFRVVYSREELDAFLRAGRRTSTSDVPAATGVPS